MLRRYLIPTLVAIAGLMVSWGIGFEVDRAQKKLFAAELRSNLKSWISLMEFSTEKEVTLAKTLVSVFADDPEISREDFRQLSTHAIKLYPDLESLFWVPEINADQRATYEAAMQSVRPGFFLKDFAGPAGFIPAAPKAVYRPVFYLNGGESSDIYLGWDLSGFGELGSMFSSLELMENQVSMRFIPRITDLMSPHSRPELQMLLTTPMGTVVQLPDGTLSKQGYLVFLVNFSLIFNYFGELPGSDTLHISVTMGSGASKRAVFEVPPEEGELEEEYAAHSVFSNRATSSWEVTLIPTDKFFAAKSSSVKYWVWATGSAITLLLVVYLYTIQRRTALVQEMVELRTEELQEANHELDRLSRTDYLTGVANRRYFEESLEREWSRAARGKYPVTLLMIDVDFFKLYNDRYGHIEGDYCLQQVVRALNVSVKRPADLVARFGGEEFAVLLPDTDNGGLELAERCRRKIEQLEIEHLDSTVSDYVTASVGVASLIPAGRQPARALVKAADDALYQAKNEGRNRVRSG